jgi:hypothetical protein
VQVNLIVGHHSHVIQPISQVNGVWVVVGDEQLPLRAADQRQVAAKSQDGVLVSVTFSPPPTDRGPYRSWSPTAGACESNTTCGATRNGRGQSSGYVTCAPPPTAQITTRTCPDEPRARRQLRISEPDRAGGGAADAVESARRPFMSRVGFVA